MASLITCLALCTPDASSLSRPLPPPHYLPRPPSGLRQGRAGQRRRRRLGVGQKQVQRRWET
eukprot:1267053-Rhodomonas_salina.1